MYGNKEIVFTNRFIKPYRYGFNGKEIDTEGMGGGSSTYDYGFRVYNTSLGRFLSVDPLSAKFAFYTPYQFAGSKPIVAIDLDGLEDCWVHIRKFTTGATMIEPMYADEKGFENFKNEKIMALNLDPNTVPSTGTFITYQEFKEDVGFTLQTAYIPAVTIDGRTSYEIFKNGLEKTMTGATEALNTFGHADNGYEYEDLFQSADFSGTIKMPVSAGITFGLSAGIYSTDENQAGFYILPSLEINLDNMSAKEITSGNSISRFLNKGFKPEIGFGLNLHTTNKFSSESTGATQDVTTGYSFTAPPINGFNLGYSKEKSIITGAENSTISIGKGTSNISVGIKSTISYLKKTN